MCDIKFLVFRYDITSDLSHTKKLNYIFFLAPTEVRYFESMTDGEGNYGNFDQQGNHDQQRGTRKPRTPGVVSRVRNASPDEQRGMQSVRQQLSFIEGANEVSKFLSAIFNFWLAKHIFTFSGIRRKYERERVRGCFFQQRESRTPGHATKKSW